MQPDQFWNCTHYDIISYIKAHNEKTKNELKSQAKILYNISLNIISGINGRKISFNKLFPTFKEDEQETQSWQNQKEIVKRFAEKYNLKKKLEKEAMNDLRRTQCQNNGTE